MKSAHEAFNPPKEAKELGKKIGGAVGAKAADSKTGKWCGVHACFIVKDVISLLISVLLLQLQHDKANNSKKSCYIFQGD